MLNKEKVKKRKEKKRKEKCLQYEVFSDGHPSKY